MENGYNSTGLYTVHVIKSTYQDATFIKSGQIRLFRQFYREVYFTGKFFVLSSQNALVWIDI